MTAFAYCLVVLIWSTTALGISWTVASFGFLPAVALRMLLTLPFAWIVCRCLRISMPRSPAALRTYAAGGMNLYGAMALTYLGAQTVNSGLIAVLYGTGPLLTGMFSVLWLRQRLALHHWAGLCLALSGLMVIHQHVLLGHAAAAGALIVLAGALVQAVGSVWIKRLDAGVPPVALTLGSLYVALPLYGISWWLGGWSIPAEVPPRALLALIYMAIFATLVAFSLYGLLLQRLQPVSVALIQLITPVTSLLLGRYLNHEVVTPAIWFGTALIVAGLLVYQWRNGVDNKQG